MTDRDKDLAREHVEWLTDLLGKIFESWSEITRELMIQEFVHGMKHGREAEEEEQVIRRELPKDV